MYCRECGKEIDEKADYCPHCGAKAGKPAVRIRQPRGSGWDAGKTLALVIGAGLLLLGIPVTLGGGALLGVTGFLDRGEGYIGVEGVNLETDTQALVARELDVAGFTADGVVGPPIRIWKPDFTDFLSFRVKAESNNGKRVFIGILRQQDALGYLGSAEYSQVTRFRMDNPWGRDPYVEYRLHRGEAITVSPTELDVWVAEATGYGTQTLTWSPEPGKYWLVIMNADSSAVVDVETGVSVKAPVIVWVARGLFVGGLALTGVGATVIYYGVVKPRRR